MQLRGNQISVDLTTLCTHMHVGINVSFTSESYMIGENDGAVSVCATIIGGTIERSVSVVIQSEDVGTASRKKSYDCIII